jgi:hypothetical protein
MKFWSARLLIPHVLETMDELPQQHQEPLSTILRDGMQRCYAAQGIIQDLEQQNHKDVLTYKEILADELVRLHKQLYDYIVDNDLKLYFNHFKW